jgi:sugar phosphate isomerase/epimerase
MPLTHPLSIQLYSARNFPPVEAQLAVVKANGYDNVETFGPWHDYPAATRALLDAQGLTAKSAHIDLETLESRPVRALEIARRLGVEIVVAPYLTPPQRPATREGWQALGSRLARIRERLVAEGLRFAWHNHDFEFVALPDGSFPIEHVLGDALLWEADIAWIVRGKSDPRLWLDRYRGRIPLVHVKDIAPPGKYTDEEGWADVGAGIVPWRDLWPRCLAACAEIMIAEHDNPSDFQRFARVSAEAMRGFAEGAKR